MLLSGALVTVLFLLLRGRTIVEREKRKCVGWNRRRKVLKAKNDAFYALTTTQDALRESERESTNKIVR